MWHRLVCLSFPGSDWERNEPRLCLFLSHGGAGQPVRAQAEPGHEELTMKLPRWLVIGLLGSSVLAVLAAATGWSLWPELTAKRYREAIASRNFDTANGMMSNGAWITSEAGAIHLQIDTRGFG